MLTLKLFNVVREKKSDCNPFISEDGFVISPNAMWAKDRILAYYENEKLNGNDLNKTFHKSWSKIKNSSRYELFLEQIAHYLSTYGTDFEGEVYIPDEVLNVPDVKLSFKLIKGVSDNELIEKCLGMLRSGMALNEETINDLLTILVDELKYKFTGEEGIRNKEAIIKIADMYGVYPNDTMEFFRYIVYRATGESLLIKNSKAIAAIKASSFNPAVQFEQFGLEKLATVFNRYKPLFLAFKSKCPSTINKIAKLSKTHHKAMVQNPLNCVTSRKLVSGDVHWLNNATIYALFKAMSACYSRMKGQDAFVYRIRNGKSWIADGGVDKEVCSVNYDFISDYMKTRFDMSGIKIFVPEDVKYALPTSEKMFVGNIPTGTRFYGKKMAVGIYWENGWGARDLDLSGQNIDGKIGWNSSYNQNSGSLMYSGDMTSAPNGAVEYLYANNGLSVPTLVMNNVFSGSDECGYKIVVGKGDKVSKDYMMNPNNLFAEVKCQSVQKQTVLGMLIPKKDKQCFVLLNFGAGHARVSGYSEVANTATRALYQQWNKPLTFNKVVKMLGAEIVNSVEEADVDLSIDNLSIDSFNLEDITNRKEN